MNARERARLAVYEGYRKAAPYFTAASNLSDQAARIFDYLGSGNRLLVPHEGKSNPLSGTLCAVITDPLFNPPVQIVEYVSATAALELSNSGLITPLTEFLNNQRMGWRERFGDLGERAAIFACTQ